MLIRRGSSLTAIAPKILQEQMWLNSSKISIVACRKKNSVWSEDQFLTWSKHDFEEYYPGQFSQQIAAVLALTGKQEKREAKKALLNQVVTWCDEFNDEAKLAFRDSAAEVIERLQIIENKLFK